MRHGAIPLACLILSSALPAAAAHCTVSSPATAEIVEHGLLNPSLPVERRQHLADKLLCSALAGNPASQELAGTLYLQGRSRRGNVLPRDLSRARRLLTAAANRGQRHAMHRLAELELGDGHAYEAALWSRVEHELFGPSKPAVEQLHRRAEAGVSPDAQLEADVALKVRAIREAMETDSPANRR
jgi:TPR repeat protein